VRAESVEPMPFLLDRDAPHELTRFLQARNWLDSARHVVRLDKAGDGNMNLTLRASVDDGTTFIAKQSRGFVEKYPQIAAPAERILSEVAFYQAIAASESLRQRMPTLLHVAPVDHLACFSDLGAAADMSDVYAGVDIGAATLDELLGWLSDLHHLELAPAAWGAPLANRAMRQLNYAHIFAIPLDPAAAPSADAITPGLGEVADELRCDTAYVAAVTRLGTVYLADGRILLHGDFFPGSWLRHANGVKIIDPEFAFFGRPEFDLGVLIAHLTFAGWTLDAAHAALGDSYASPPGFDWRLARGFAGVELMRRILGVAQLPLAATLERKREWLALSRTLVRGART